MRRRRAALALTPLIDVVFILLVFFMLASSFLDWRAIELEPPAEAVAGAGAEGALLVELGAGGLRLSGVAIGADALEAELRQRLAARPEQRILVRPAPGVSLQATVALLERIAEAGGREVALVREVPR